MVQGQIGNCWIIAAISSLAEVPERITSAFINTEISDVGIYAVKQYAIGVPFTQIVDDYLPMYAGQPMFTNYGKDGSIWGAVMEKSLAKRYGNYEHTVAGWMYAGVSAINGSPWVEFKHHETEKSTLWEKIKMHDKDADIMTAGTEVDSSNGVVGGHAYSIIDHVILEGRRGEEVKLVMIRNPWGEEGFTGRWSDDASEWTEAHKDAVEKQTGFRPRSNNEGIFFMDLDEFHETFSETQINQDTRNWHFDYFLRMDDKSTNKGGSDYPDCSDCTMHTINVTNNGPAQEIYVGSHVW